MTYPVIQASNMRLFASDQSMLNAKNDCLAKPSELPSIQQIANLTMLFPKFCFASKWDERRYPDRFCFCNDDDDPNFHDNGPKLHHFCNTSLIELQEEKQQLWREILNKEITIPAHKVTVYDDHGDPVNYWYSEQDLATPLTLPQQPTRDSCNTPEEVPDHQCSSLSTSN